MEHEITEYVEYLFIFALDKCHNLHDAEDLTQETLLAALQYQHNGGKIANPKSWLKSTLLHKWNDLLRRKYRLPLVSVNYFDEFVDTPVEPEPDRPVADEVRRETAFLARNYREVIYLHYMQGMKVDAIAERLGIPKGTVLSRLSAGREQMRKGFDKMEYYDKQSCKPERLDISWLGRQGFHGEPTSLVAGDLMKQNILIAAYEKPVTVVEISRGLGIPTAYVESAVNDLVKSELMVRSGGKVYTDFIIFTPEQRLKELDTQIELVRRHYTELSALVGEFTQSLRETLKAMCLPARTKPSESQLNKLCRYFLLHLFSNAIFVAVQRIIPSDETYPPRPDGGSWIAHGFKYPEDFDFDNFRFMKYSYGGERRAYIENCFNARLLDLHIYDIYPDFNLYERGPVELSDGDLAKLLYLILRSIPIETTGFDPMYLKDLPHLKRCSILRGDEGEYYVDIPVLRPNEYTALEEIRMRYMHRLADLLEPWLSEIMPELECPLPSHLTGRVARFRRYYCYVIPIAYIDKAIEAGDFDDKASKPPMVLLVDDSNL